MKERLVVNRSFWGNGPFCFFSSSITALLLYVIGAIGSLQRGLRASVPGIREWLTTWS